MRSAAAAGTSVLEISLERRGTGRSVRRIYNAAALHRAAVIPLRGKRFATTQYDNA
jgi:hypothetical protein